MKLEIRQLRHFNSDLKRDIITDALASPVRVPDQQLLAQVVNYGNDFLKRHKAMAEDDNCVIWFDVHFGDPAQVGMTWAYHPQAPYDSLFGETWFWRCWTELSNVADGKSVYTLEQCQLDFAEYTMQFVTG